MAVFDRFLFLRRYQEFKGRYGLDSRTLSVLLKVPLGTLRKIESGQRFPNWITLINICDGFGTSVDYMLGRTDDPTPPVPSAIYPRGRSLREMYIKLHPNSDFAAIKYQCAAYQLLKHKKSSLSDSERKALEGIIETCLSLITTKESNSMELHIGNPIEVR